MIREALCEPRPGFYVVGPALIPIYLMDGERPAIFDAGMAFLGEVYAAELRRILGHRQPAYLFLTHSHFDHCGAVSYLKACFPEMKVAAHSLVGRVMERPNAVNTIRTLNQFALADARRRSDLELVEQPFEPFALDLELADGDQVVLGDNLTVRAIATPGHTRDQMSYYLPERRILLASEAVGARDQSGYVFTEFLVDYEQWLSSLRKLQQLEVDLLCPGHMYLFSGEDAERHIQESIETAIEWRALMEEIMDEEQDDIERSVARMRAHEYDPKPQPKQPEPAYLLNLRARVQHIAALRRESK